MDAARPEPGSQWDDRIAALVNEYFDRKQAGEDITADSFAAEHPELAEELKPYLEGLSILGGLSTAGEAAVTWPETATGDLALPTIGGYVLHEEIGRGGMGVVYKALQVSTKRIVALKVVLAGSFASPSVRRRFKREVELAARLQHPSIVRVLESGRVEGQRYYAMDYVDGVPLDRYLSAAQPDRKTILKIFMQICAAVEYAHGHGVIHRDLKPANVLIDDEGVPHILDFGLAKAIDQAETDQTFVTRASGPGQVMGTLPYISPEQAAGTLEEIDARTDIYAIGVMLYESLTGSMPYPVTGRPTDILRRILEDSPAPPSSFPKRADSELDTIILKALEKEKERRYQTARDLGEDLRRHVEGEPLLARPPSSLYLLRKKLRKHPLPAAAAILIALAVIIAVVALSVESRRRHQSIAVARRLALQHQRTIESGEASRALADAKALYARRPDLPEGVLVWAQALCANEQQQDAIVLLERAAREDPTRWACRLLLSEIYRLTGEVERADTLDAQAQRDAPDTWKAWYLRSFATFQLPQAVRCAEEAVERESASAPSWERLTYLQLELGDLDGALRGAQRLIDLGEQRPVWTLFQGHVLARQGRIEEAIDRYTEVTELNPRGRDAFRYRAHAYRRVKEHAKAVDDYTMVIELAPEPAAVVWDYYQRATPLWILGRTNEALEDYRRVRSLLGRPVYSDARQYLILCELGRVDEARTVLDAALRDVEDHWLRQIFRCLDGRITPEELIADGMARDNLEQLCEAYYYAGEVSLRAGRRETARDCYHQCLQTGLEFDPDTAFGTPMNEFDLARWRLESVFAGPDATAPEEN